MIEGFQGEYRWLSNFWPAIIQVSDVTYPTVEHAYVASKTHMLFSPQDLKWFLSLSPGQVKRVGRQLDLRPDWENSKFTVMYELTKIKYGNANLKLQEKLIATHDEYIEETNHWGDTYWGICDGEGHNWLGYIIMQVRDEIISENLK